LGRAGAPAVGDAADSANVEAVSSMPDADNLAAGSGPTTAVSWDEPPHAASTEMHIIIAIV